MNLTIEKTDFHEAWETAVYKVVKLGESRVIGSGEERKPIRDTSTIIVLRGKAIQQVLRHELHPLYPTRNIEEYLQEYTDDYHSMWKQQPLTKRFAYLYYDRLINYGMCWELSGKIYQERIDQLDILKTGLSKDVDEKISNNRHIAITWYPNPDGFSRSPPCLNLVQVRLLNESNVEVQMVWRSRDLFRAWQSNVVAVVCLLNEKVIKPDNCEIERIVDYSTSLHVYETDVPEASKVMPKAYADIFKI